MIGDTNHEIIELGKGVELHRFLNKAGEPYSAIYELSKETGKKIEMYSCERGHERKMLNALMKHGWIDV